MLPTCLPVIPIREENPFPPVRSMSLGHDLPGPVSNPVSHPPCLGLPSTSGVDGGLASGVSQVLHSKEAPAPSQIVMTGSRGSALV